MQSVKSKGIRNEKVAQMARIGMLSGIAILLSITPLGYLPINPVMQVTFMHIPVIIAAIIDGYTGGIIVGLIFGITSLVHGLSTVLAPIAINPMISVVPRILIGVISALVYKKTRNSAVTAAAGTFTNTALFLTAVYFFGASEFASINKLPMNGIAKALAVIGATNGIPEIIFAVVIISAIMKALKKVYK